MSNWKDLSIRDRAAIIRQSVSDGIYNLGEIRNRFDKGGNIFSGENKNQSTQKMHLWGEFDYKPEVKEKTLQDKFSLNAPYLQPQAYRDGNVIGVDEITDKIPVGSSYLYTKSYLSDRDIYRDSDGRTFAIANHKVGSYDPGLINTNGMEKLSVQDLRKELPKRDYVGGDAEEARVKMIKMVPGLTQEVAKRADSYGIDKNLILRRMAKEGIVDQWIRSYNDVIDTYDQQNYLKDIMGQAVAGYGGMGLDDVGQRLLDGLYELKDKTASWETESWNPENEKGRTLTNVPLAHNMASALEMMAADMNYTRDVLRGRGIPEDKINIYINAAYNMGMNNKRLNEPDYVERTYSYPNYFELYNLKSK